MKLIISNKSREEFKEFLKEKRIDYLETIDNPSLDERISDHPDLSIFSIDRKNIVVDKKVFTYYKENLPGINVFAGDSVERTYPKDSIYNVVKFKSYFIHNDFTEKIIDQSLRNKGYEFLKVKQGYTRCSSIILNNSIITADYGIYKSLKDKLNIKLIDSEKIELDGFDQGFLGGTCGMLDRNKLLFNGNIENLKSYDIIYRQSKKENIELIYPSCKLLDTGSLIRIG